MNDLPRVSVCIDVFNYADFLPQAIESVREQTLADFELIVGDDCSTDDSLAIAQRYAQKDARIVVQQNARNLGMVRNRNACLRRARAPFVKFVHADDFLCAPNALARMVARMESNPALSIVACVTRFVDANAKTMGTSPRPFGGERLLAGTSVITRCLREQKNLIGGPSAVLFRRDRAVRGFDERYFHAADLEMWFHLLEQGCFGYLAEPLVAYRWHLRQQTQKDRATLSQSNDNRALLRDYLDKPYVRLKRPAKDYLLHDAARQIARRGRKLGLKSEAAAAIDAYGRGRYFGRYAGYMLWRHARKPACRLAFLLSRGPAAVPDPPRPLGINVAGFFQGEYGIGESSRAFCRAVEATGLPHARINIASKNHRNADASVSGFSDRNPYRINLMTFSFDYARRFFRDRGRRFFEGRRNVALWYWERETFPARWHSNFDYYDEIWTPSHFCQQAFAAVSPIPVHKITYPLFVREAAPLRDRSAFGIALDACVFLFTWDYCSTIARKNPLAVIAAFQQAFGPNEKAVLVLKSINRDYDPAATNRVRKAAARGGANIICLESPLPAADMDALFACADCYVSLHRSEGLGLGMAQAMALGKPVIATGYSGNREFMNAGNSLLVDYDLVESDEDCYPYEPGGLWAEPSVARAAEHLRWVYTHPEAAARMGRQAGADVRRVLDPATTRREILARVAELG